MKCHRGVICICHVRYCRMPPPVAEWCVREKRCEMVSSWKRRKSWYICSYSKFSFFFFFFTFLFDVYVYTHLCRLSCTHMIHSLAFQQWILNTYLKNIVHKRCTLCFYLSEPHTRQQTAACMRTAVNRSGHMKINTNAPAVCAFADLYKHDLMCKCENAN